MKKTIKLKRLLFFKLNFDLKIKLAVISVLVSLSQVQANETHAVNLKVTSKLEKTLSNSTEKELSIIKQKSITGIVKDKDGIPIPGVSVIIEGTTTGAQTDFDGSYTLEAKKGDVLIFSYLGYKTQKVTVGDSATIELVMEEEISALDEVVVIGYGTQKKRNITAAIATVDTKDLNNRPVNSISEMLTASAPGLNITINSSAPNAIPAINLRGFTGLSVADNGDLQTSAGAPLIIIDGVPLADAADLVYVNPQDVENISVLKDASATAVYGSRAPNGAILITTKSGKKDQKMAIQFSSELRISQPIGLPQTLSGSQYAIERNKRAYNSRVNPLYTDEVIDRILAYEAGQLSTTGEYLPNGNFNTAPFTYNASEDHIDNAFRDNVYNQSHNLSISGGSSKTTYFASFNALDADGAYDSPIDNLKRYATNFRVNTDITDWINIGLNSRYSRQQTIRPTIWNQNQNDSRLFDFLAFPPTIPSYNDNGTPNEFQIAANLDGSSGQYERADDVLTLQATTQIKLFKGLTLNADYTWRKQNQFDKIVELVFGGTNIDGTYIQSRRSPPLSFIRNVSRDENYHTANLNLNYQTSIGNHNINALVGYNEEAYDYTALRAENSDFYSPAIQSLSTTYGDNLLATDDINTWAVQGYFGRIQYDYKEKYLIEFSGRYDASSRFAPDSRWAAFFGVSGGYNIAKENFWPFKKTINQFKITGQYSESGNQTLGAENSDLYTYLPTLGTIPQAGVIINGSRPSAVTLPPILSDDNTWAKPTTIGFGLEVGMFKNKLTSNYNWYQKTIYDQIGQAIQLPEVLGTAEPVQNNAVSETRGWEFDITWRDQFNVKGSPLKYSVRASLWDYIGYVVEYEDNEQGLRNRWTPGQQFQELYVVKSAGIAQSQDQVLQNALRTTGWYYPGDLMFQDTNGDGLINTGVGNFWYSQGDREREGFTYPRYQYNLAMNASWKGFSLGVILQGVGHHKEFWNNKFNFGDFNFMSVEQQERGWWTADNPDAFYPRAYNVNASGNGLRPGFDNDQYTFDLSHLRIKNINISYDLPSYVLSKISVKKATLTLSGENLGFIYNNSWLKELDPISIDTQQGRTYPPSRTFSLGFRVSI